MTYSRLTVTELLRQVAPHQAVCAFNVENFDTLLPALKAAADLSAPVVIALTVPAARYMGFEFAVELVDLTARRFGTTYALHLDHCEDADDLRGAIRAGFTSANFLNEGALANDTYLRTAVALRDQYHRKDVSLEFIIGTLGHHDEPHPAQLTVDEIVAFAQTSRPDVIGFHCGSLHGMRDRRQDIDTPLIAKVATATRLPIVLARFFGGAPASAARRHRRRDSQDQHRDGNPRHFHRHRQEGRQFEWPGRPQAAISHYGDRRGA